LVYSETIRFTIIKNAAIKNTITANFFEIDGNDFIGSTANNTLSKREKMRNTSLILLIFQVILGTKLQVLPNLLY
jgi:hypothetical protein